MASLFSKEEIKNIVEQELKKQKEDLKSKIKDVISNSTLYIDTETTGLSEDRQPVTFGTYSVKNGAKNYLLQQKTQEETIEYLAQAMNLSNKGSVSLSDSSRELRELFGIKNQALLKKSKKITDPLEELRTAIKTKMQDRQWVIDNFIDADQLMDILSNADSISGYNSEFDIKALENYFSNFRKKTKFKNNIARKIKDVRKDRVQASLGNNGVGFDSIEFLGKQKLQDLVKLLYGQTDSHAHDASADAKMTAFVDQDATDEILKAIVNVVEEIRKDKKIEVRNKNGGFTKEYRELYASVFNQFIESLHQQQNAQIDNEDNISSVNSKKNNSSKVKNEVESQARSIKQRIRAVYKKLTPESQKAFTGEQLIKRMKKFNLDITSLTSPKYGNFDENYTPQESMEYYLSEIIKTVESDPQFGVVLNTDGQKIILGIYDKTQQQDENNLDYDKMAKIEIGLANEEGLLRVGNKEVANLLTPIISFNEDEEGNITANPVLSTVQEGQLRELLPMLKKMTGDEKENSKLRRKLVSGDFEGAESLLKYVSSEALTQAPSGINNNILRELNFPGGKKNPEQMAGILSTMSIKEMAQSLYRNTAFREKIDEIYQELAKKRSEEVGYSVKARTVNPNELTTDEIVAINVAFALLNNGLEGPDDKRIQNMEDGFIKRVLSNQELFSLIKKDLSQFIKAGLGPEMNSLKEEQFIAGLSQFSGSQDIMFGNVFSDPSSRALNQSFNYLPKKNSSKVTRENLFTSIIGRNLGVEYEGGQLAQYVGAFVDNDRLYKALKEAGANQDLIASVLEGGIILPSDLKDDFFSYLEESKEFKGKKGDKVISKLNVEGLVDSYDIYGLDIGERMDIGQKSGKNIELAKNFNLGADDILQAIEKTNSGFRLIISRAKEIKEGTKMLTGTGGRKTARILPKDIFESVTRNLGVEQATFLTEKSSLNSKNLMETFRGRISYIVEQAQELGVSLDEIESALKKMPVLGKAIQRVDDKFELTAFYNRDENEFQYLDEKGRNKSLFNGKTKEEKTEQIKKALLESYEGGQETAISYLGKTLLGDQYESTKPYIATSINMAREIPYFEASGSGTAKYLEEKQGVRATTRERDAFAERGRKYRDKVTNQQGLDLYLSSEEQVLTSFGEQGKKAQQDINKIISAYQNRTIPTNEDKTIELVWGGGTHDNKIDISTIADHIIYGKNGSTGVAKEDYSNTIGYIIQQVANNLGIKNPNVILNLESLLGQGNFELTNNEYKKIPLANLRATTMDDGSIMPSITDTLGTQVISVLRDAIESGDFFNLNKIAEMIYEKYETILTDKDGELIRKAISSYLPNATHAKAVGINENFVKAQGTDSAYNTSYVSSSYLRDLLKYQSSNKKGLEKNVQSLYWMYKTGGDQYIDKDFLSSNEKFGDVKQLQNLTAKELRKAENQLIKKITEQIKQGKKILLDTHRYPSTSGLDIHGGFVGINDRLGKGAVGLTRGQSILMNADYDGDTIQLRTPLLTNNFNSEEEFKQAYESAVEIADLESKLAKHMEEWEIAQKSKPVDKKEEEDALAAEILGRDNMEFVSIMSKYNKGYVGRFSNLSTNLRRSKEFSGFGVLGPDATQEDKMQAAFSTIINAFTESLEQDAISAKKVAARMLKSGDQAGLNELSSLEDLMRQGKLVDAVQKSIDLGILKTDENGYFSGRQMEIARTLLEITDEDTAKQLGLDKGISKDILIKAIQELANYAKNKGFELVDMLYNNESVMSGNSRTDKESKRKDKAITARLKTPTGKKFRKISSKPVSSDSNKPKIEADLVYKVLPVKDGDSYDEDHQRIFKEDGRIVSGDTSVTKLLHKDQNLSFQNKEDLEKKSAMGTYAHKVVEILNNNNVDTIQDLSDEEKQKIVKAQEKLNQALGVLTQETVDNLNERAETALKVAKEKEAFSGNLSTEVTLGGRLQDVGLLSGQADLISYNENGVTIGDWKFSNDGSNITNATRIAQGSAYLAMWSEKLKQEKEQLSGKNNLSNEEQKKLLEIEEQLQALEKERTIKIIRNFEKNDEIFTEILTAPALDEDQIFNILRKSKMEGKIDLTGIDLKDAKTETYDSAGNLVSSGIGRSPVKSTVRKAKKIKVGTGSYYSDQAEETKTISAYVSQYKKVIDAQTQIYKIQKEIQTLENSNASKEEIEAKKQSYEKAIEYFKTLKAGLDSLGKYSKENGNHGIIGQLLLSEDGGAKLEQKIEEINKKAFLDRSKIVYSQTKTGGQNAGGKSGSSLMNQYLKNYEQQLTIQRNMQRTELQMDSANGQKKKDLQQLNQAYEQQLINLKKQAPIFDEEAKTLNGIKLTDEQILEFRQKQNKIALNHESLQAKINAQQRESKGLIQQIGEGFKASFRNLVDYSAAYQIIGLIRQAYTELINTTKQLDSAMVDLQIASGNTKEEVKDMLKDFSDLGDELGRTTQEVASAANDWLRAGYDSVEAAELTKASMQLSTLGMIESADSTSYLISMLKGWKLEVEDVTSVVDKLTVVICGVCLVISIGHKLNCR